MPTNLSIHINNRVAFGLGLGTVGVGPDVKNCSLDNGPLVLLAKISFVSLKHQK